MLVVPLKFMCSTQCETPVCPVISSLEPTLYQHHTEASGAVCTSRTSTVNPLSRTVSLTAVLPDGRAHTSMSSIIQVALRRPADPRAHLRYNCLLRCTRN